MTAKKRWTSSFQTESQELVEKISWNSSSSEEGEEEVKRSKRFKPCFPQFQREMKLTVMNPIKINKKTVEKPQEEVTKVDSTESVNISTFTSEENIIDFGEKSPILEPKPNFFCSIKSDSPIISQNFIRETSPVITNRELMKKIKIKRREFINRSTKIDGSSPDIFLSQCSKIIEENESPDKTLFIPTTNCSQDMGSIELVSSQDSSSLVIVDSTTSDSSIPKSDLSNQCYHQPSPRRKNYKKNGLLDQLQKVLNLQKSRLSLWHHDIFCKNVIPSKLEHIQGKINNKWKDFGCTILNCSKVIGDSIKAEDVFLISLGCNPDANLQYNTDEIIRIFPPFKEQLVQYENKEVKMYYNVTKILTEPLTGS